MEWQSDGFILSAGVYGEHSYLVEIFTEAHGKYRGIFRKKQKAEALLQVGRSVKATWRARLESQLGSWTVEEITPQVIPFARLLDNPLGLNTLQSIVALFKELVPERQLYPKLYEGLRSLLTQLNEPPKLLSILFLRFLLLLLQELGYGLDFNQCAVTGEKTRLTHVSPATGKGVCAEVAACYPGRLLELPLCLYEIYTPETLSQEDAEKSFKLLTFFLKKWLLDTNSKALQQLTYHQQQMLGSLR